LMFFSNASRSSLLTRTKFVFISSKLYYSVWRSSKGDAWASIILSEKFPLTNPVQRLLTLAEVVSRAVNVFTMVFLNALDLFIWSTTAFYRFARVSNFFYNSSFWSSLSNIPLSIFSEGK
jgi:hypothetical protein